MPRNGERAFRNPPPGGAAALAQQTTATQLTTLGASRLNFRAPSRPGLTFTRRPPRKRRAPSRASIRPRKRVSSRKTRAYLVRGSAAAKRHMAKLQIGRASCRARV